MVSIEEKWFIAIAVICVGLCVFAYFNVGEYRSRNKLDECVETQPVVCIYGSISHYEGFFSNGPVVYRLWFKGKTSNSGDACQIMRRVTEARYNRYMYR